MVTGFPPYDVPTTQDERFDIISNGDLMRQLQAWESAYICCDNATYALFIYP